MRPSVHAMYRWIEHFGERDIALEFAQAKRCGKKVRRQIAAQCPVRYKPRFCNRGVYYLVSPSRAIFVVAPGEFIVDIFPLKQQAQAVA